MKIKGEIRNKIQKILLVMLLIMVAIMLYEVEKFSKAGRLVNYTGFVSVGVQRYVKLELFGIHNQELVDRNNKILDGLWNGSDELGLPKINDENYREKLKIQKEYWPRLYKIVEDMEHSEGEKKAKLRTIALADSETYFEMSDDTAAAAEAYAEKLAGNMGILEIILAVIVVGIVVFMVMDYADKKFLVEQNVKLGQKAYIDAHTGLPNKSRCEEIFNDKKIVTKDVCVVMFDLNGLKTVNDNLGHIAGDDFIKGFAKILKKSVRNQDFVGRYGGDEFVAVIYGVGNEGLKKIFDRVKENVSLFNKEKLGLNLSYAQGYSFSRGRDNCTMKMLLSEADEDMYKNKMAMKEK